MGAACLSICVRENRKSYQKTDRRTFKGRTPEARSCHTLRHRQPAHRRLTPLSHCFPAVERFKNPLRSNGLEQHKVQTQSRRVENSSGHAVGAWGNLCKAGCLVYRQNTAHGQITGAQYHCSMGQFCHLGTWNQRLLSMRASGRPSRRLIASSSSIFCGGKKLSGFPICRAIK
jgi:hypothetical protein